MSEEIQRCNRGDMKARWPAAFDTVKEPGCSFPNVEATTRYDGSPVLKVHGVFMAGLAMHASAEPNTLVVRTEFEEREGLLEDAPETYDLRQTQSRLTHFQELSAIEYTLRAADWLARPRPVRLRVADASDNPFVDNGPLVFRKSTHYVQ